MRLNRVFDKRYLLEKAVKVDALIQLSECDSLREIAIDCVVIGTATAYN